MVAPLAPHEEAKLARFGAMAAVLGYAPSFSVFQTGTISRFAKQRLKWWNVEVRPRISITPLVGAGRPIKRMLY